MGTMKHILTACALGAVLLTGSGCRQVQQAVANRANNDPAIRAKAVEGARSSCVKGAKTDFPQIPNRDQVITDYCECFATKGLNVFSNADLISIGLSGTDKMSAENKKKIDDAATMCVNETLTKQPAQP